MLSTRQRSAACQLLPPRFPAGPVSGHQRCIGEDPRVPLVGAAPKWACSNRGTDTGASPEKASEFPNDCATPSILQTAERSGTRGSQHDARGHRTANLADCFPCYGVEEVRHSNCSLKRCRYEKETECESSMGLLLLNS